MRNLSLSGVAAVGAAAVLGLGMRPALASQCDFAGNLVVNCGFETGDFTGWTQTGQVNSLTFVIGPGVIAEADVNDPHSGKFFAVQGALGSPNYLSQTLTTQVGSLYIVSVWMASEGGGPNEYDVEWNGTPLFDQFDIAATTWQNLIFTATGTGSDTLTISSQNDPDFLATDDVSVSPVPEPASISLLGAALLLGGLARRRRKA